MMKLFDGYNDGILDGFPEDCSNDDCIIGNFDSTNNRTSDSLITWFKK